MIGFVLVSLFYANSIIAQSKSVHDNTALQQPSMEQWNQEFKEGGYIVKITKLETGGFGYQILNENKTIIYQDSKSFFTIPLTKIENAKHIAIWHIHNVKLAENGKIPFDTQKALS